MTEEQIENVFKYLDSSTRLVNAICNKNIKTELDLKMLDGMSKNSENLLSLESIHSHNKFKTEYSLAVELAKNTLQSI